MRGACVVLLAGCGPMLPVPMAPMPLDDVGHGHLEKGGVPVSGMTCGEQFERAVAGVRDAEDDMHACWDADVVAAGGAIGALVLGPTAIVSAHEGDHRAAEIEAGATMASLLISVVAAFVVMHYENRAVRTYNDSIH